LCPDYGKLKRQAALADQNALEGKRAKEDLNLAQKKIMC
jgi:hypothetical protein